MHLKRINIGRSHFRTTRKRNHACGDWQLSVLPKIAEGGILAPQLVDLTVQSLSALRM